jgi:hypothetical protein
VREKASERTFPVIENAANLCSTFADAEEVPMTRYRGNVEAVRNLVRETEVHRDVYIADEVFQLEMEHLFANTWIYVGHDSQVSKPGDYFGTTIGGFDGDTYRQYREGVAQPLSAQGNAHHDRHVRQYREILSLSLSRVDVQNGRLTVLYPAAEGIREHRA